MILIFRPPGNINIDKKNDYKLYEFNYKDPPVFFEGLIQITTSAMKKVQK
jgi:hypothetical protein